MSKRKICISQHSQYQTLKFINACRNRSGNSLLGWRFCCALKVLPCWRSNLTALIRCEVSYISCIQVMARIIYIFPPLSEIHTMKFTLLQCFCWKQSPPRLTFYTVWVGKRDDLQCAKIAICDFVFTFLLLIAPFRTSPRWKAQSSHKETKSSENIHRREFYTGGFNFKTWNLNIQ